MPGPRRKDRSLANIARMLKKMTLLHAAAYIGRVEEINMEILRVMPNANRVGRHLIHKVWIHNLCCDTRQVITLEQVRRRMKTPGSMCKDCTYLEKIRRQKMRTFKPGPRPGVKKKVIGFEDKNEKRNCRYTRWALKKFTPQFPPRDWHPL